MKKLGLSIDEDPFILEKRKKLAWLHYDDVRERVIKDIIKTRG
jgi:hypothetical protein